MSILLVALAAAGCRAGAPRPSPSPTPLLGDRPATATAEKDGIAVELWLSAREAHVGDRLLALVRVSNRGTSSPTWETNTCGTGPAPIRVEAPAGLPAGRAWTGLAAEFKGQLLREFGAVGNGRAVIGTFWDAETIDLPNVACPAFSAMAPLLPGQGVEKMIAWDVGTKSGLTIEAGTAALVAQFSSSAGEVEAVTSVDISGDSAAGRTIVEYVDTALANEAFHDWLNEADSSSWINTSVTFWPNEEGEYPARPEYEKATTGAVDVGLFRDGPEFETYGGVIIDTGTGEILGTRFGE